MALIQEPWLVCGRVAGLSDCKGTIIAEHSATRIRACIVVRSNLKALTLNELCSQDMATILIKHHIVGGIRELVLASVYLPYDAPDPPPSVELDKLVSYCGAKRLQLLICADANSHSEAWGSSDTNKRGEHLLEFIGSSGLVILNRGKEPTFVTSRRREVIDITLATPLVSNNVARWYVSEEPSFSDHRYVVTELSGSEKEITTSRDPRKTNWNGYREELALRVRQLSAEVKSPLALEHVSNDLQGAIMAAFEMNCPLTRRPATSKSWWTRELDKLRKNTRRLFGAARRTGDWDSYARSLTEFNKAVRKAKRKDWRKHCEETTSTPAAAKLQKILSKQPANPLGTLKVPGGGFTADGKDTLELMLQTHLPDSVITSGPDDQLEQEGLYNRTSRASWETAKKVVTYGRARWAVTSFQPFKSPGPDGVYPVLLQQGWDIIGPLLSRLFRASVAFGYVPHNWKMARVVFIPKPGKNPLDPKAYRPITLSSFILKALEKLMGLHVQQNFLKERPLHINQHAYRVGKSCDSALHQLVSRIEEAIEHKEVALGTFLDIEGAFNNTTYDAMLKAAERHGVDETCRRWIRSTLHGRKAQASLFGETLRVTATRGTAQGGAISPCLWNLVVDELLVELNNKGFYAQGYADDICILIRGKIPQTVAELTLQALKVVENWCERVSLSVNPSKTVIVPFTLRRNLEGLRAPELMGVKLNLAEEVRYLGLMLDTKLTWNAQLSATVAKGKKTLMIARRAIGKTWGLSPGITKWVYTAIVRPSLTHACAVWWTKMNQSKAVKELEKVQRLALLCVTGVMKSTPTAAMEVLVGLPPLHLLVKGEARLAAYRLQVNGAWRQTSLGHTKIVGQINDPILNMVSDWSPVTYKFDLPFRLGLESPAEGDKRPDGELTWFTDGSVMSGRSGAGVYGARPKVCISLPLGHYATIFQAEVVAIITCVLEIIRMGYSNRNIRILSDSQAALQAIASWRFNSKLVLECRQHLDALSATNRVELGWVPGHKGVEGNERADALAREGSAVPLTGPEPGVGVTKSAVKGAIAKWTLQQQTRHWAEIPGQRHSKLMMGRPCPSLTEEVLRLSRKKLRAVTGLITGHCTLRKHLHNMGIFHENPVCRNCGEADETATHVIFDCPAHTRWRLQYGSDLSHLSGASRARHTIEGLILLAGRMDLI